MLESGLLPPLHHISWTSWSLSSRLERTTLAMSRLSRKVVLRIEIWTTFEALLCRHWELGACMQSRGKWRQMLQMVSKIFSDNLWCSQLTGMLLHYWTLMVTSILTPTTGCGGRTGLLLLQDHHAQEWISTGIGMSLDSGWEQPPPTPALRHTGSVVWFSW